MCGQYPGSIDALATVSMRCHDNLPPYRYVIVQFPISGYVRFREVEVFTLGLEYLYIRQRNYLPSGLLCPGVGVNGNVALDSAKFFSLSQYQRTRGHPYKIYRQPCRLIVSLYSFANRIIDIWNNLSFEIVCVSSIAAFKRKLNTLILHLSF